MQTVKLLRADVIHGWYYNDQYGLPEYEKEAVILFEVDGKPHLIMNDQDFEYCPTMVEYIVNDKSPIMIFKSSDAEEAIDKIFQTTKFDDIYV